MRIELKTRSYQTFDEEKAILWKKNKKNHEFSAQLFVYNLMMITKTKD